MLKERAMGTLDEITRMAGDGLNASMKRIGEGFDNMMNTLIFEGPDRLAGMVGSAMGKMGDALDSGVSMASGLGERMGLSSLSNGISKVLGRGQEIGLPSLERGHSVSAVSNGMSMPAPSPTQAYDISVDSLGELSTPAVPNLAVRQQQIGL